MLLPEQDLLLVISEKGELALKWGAAVIRYKEHAMVRRERPFNRFQHRLGGHLALYYLLYGRHFDADGAAGREHQDADLENDGCGPQQNGTGPKGYQHAGAEQEKEKD